MSSHDSHQGSIRRTRNSSRSRIKRPADLDHATVVVRVTTSEWHEARALREKFAGASVAGEDIVLDLSEMQHLDTGALQVLLALRHAKQSEGAELRLHAVGPDIHRWLAYAGAASIFLSTSEME